MAGALEEFVDLLAARRPASEELLGNIAEDFEPFPRLPLAIFTLGQAKPEAGQFLAEDAAHRQEASWARK